MTPAAFAKIEYTGRPVEWPMFGRAAVLFDLHGLSGRKRAARCLAAQVGAYIEGRMAT
jgi:hypothetical protein